MSRSFSRELFVPEGRRRVAREFIPGSRRAEPARTRAQTRARTHTLLVFVLLALLPLSAPTHAQPLDDTHYSQANVPYDGSLTFVRLRYTPTSHRGGGGGYFDGINLQWEHDYPRADRNIMKIIDDLTAIDANTEGTNILSVGDPQIFRYPLAFLVEVGYLRLEENEVENLRAYLAKGGFLIIDDFAGWRALDNFENELNRIFPGVRLVELDAEHPIFHAFFDIPSLDIFYHPIFGVPSTFYGVYENNDPSERLMMIVNFNNDVMESWEFSEAGFIPIELSNVAYKLGVNYVMYSMTH